MSNVAPAFAEEAVIGGLLQDNQRFHDVAPLIGADHFTSPQRARVFGLIRDRVLAGEPADAVTIGEASPDDFDYVVHLAANVPGSSAVVAYAELVRENWRRREAVAVGLQLVAAARAGEEDAVDVAAGRLLALNAVVTACEYTGKQALQEAWREVARNHASDGALPGIPTGLAALDDILGGWHVGDLTIIGGRPAMGKTAFLGGLIEAAADAKMRPGVISAEQPAVQLALRRLSAVSRVAATQLRTGKLEDEDWALLQAGMATAVERDMWIYDRSAVTLDELVGIARKWKHTHGIGCLFIDYAQRITVPRADRTTEVSQVARGLKNLARDLQIPVISLAQVVKAVDQRVGDKRPTSGDLANSDELTREADQILMLYRDEVYNRETQDRGIAEILIEKNRHGPTGFKKVAFLSETMRFADLGREF
ncbi:replicative DNA helicase [Stenotrophomonas maltophilia]|uniref:replicative DNA helicase n=1 Tax=Stenotrophomonas maltophilia TaxID=40324 RepID=UPI00209B4808|nr:DnaB-like helicase C-terminal domain-containing protein [Stenotrophomonas maltophilia]MCO7494732.1 AAA family ATPase [Stenotrophomonas maltophilia]